jgi:hypothetical protein
MIYKALHRKLKIEQHEPHYLLHFTNTLCKSIDLATYRFFATVRSWTIFLNSGHVLSISSSSTLQKTNNEHLSSKEKFEDNIKSVIRSRKSNDRQKKAQRKRTNRQTRIHKVLHSKIRLNTMNTSKNWRRTLVLSGRVITASRVTLVVLLL